MTSEIQPALKVRYAEFLNPLPSQDTIAAFAPFVSKEMRLGRTYNFPVKTGLPHGVTHDDTDTAFTLNAVISPQIKEAILSGSTIALRDNVSTNDVFATMNGIANGGGQGGAFWDVWDYKTDGLMQAAELYREAALLYGPGSTSTAAANLGVVSASVSGSSLSAGQVVNLTRASWAPGLWPNFTNAKVDIYQSDATTLRASGVTLTAPTSATNRLTLTKSGSGAVVAAGDIILALGAIDVSMYGLEAICANSSTIFNIDASAYPQWRVMSQAVGGALSRKIILGASSKLVANGMTGGATMFVSGPAMSDLIEEASDLQRFLDEGEVRVQGATSVNYKTPIGRVDVKIHPYMKQGIAMLLPNGKVKRIGQTDVTFNNGKNEWFYTELADNMGAQLRNFQSQAILIEVPWHAMYFTGVSSTYDTTPA